MFNEVVKKVFTISPLLYDMQRRDDVFQKQAYYLKFRYDKHTGPLQTKYFDFNKSELMKNDIHTDTPNNWQSRDRAAIVTQSHLDVIRYAKNSGVENICIFENDVLFHKEFHQIFNRAWWKLPNDWDILYLGAYYNYEDSTWHVNNDEQEPQNLFKVEKSSLCSHAYILNKSAIDRILDDFDKLVNQGKYLIIDQFLGYATEYLGYKTFGILPKLVEQGYCGTPSLTLGLDSNIPDDFDYGDVVVREPHFEDNKSSNATRDDYTFIIHKHSKTEKAKIEESIKEIKEKNDQILNEISKQLYVSDEEQDRRLSICKKCRHFTDNGKCGKCGCSMASKTRLSNFNCPIHKF